MHVGTEGVGVGAMSGLDELGVAGRGVETMFELEGVGEGATSELEGVGVAGRGVERMTGAEDEGEGVATELEGGGVSGAGLLDDCTDGVAGTLEASHCAGEATSLYVLLAGTLKRPVAPSATL